MMMKNKTQRCVIVGGAEIKRYDRIKSCLKDNDFYICCDSGLDHCEALGMTPDLIVGDFDSHAQPETAIETIVLPREKDDTDTVYAVKEAMKRGFDDFLLIGVIGARLDHTLGNIGILYMLDNNKKQAKAIDDYSEMQVVSSEPTVIPDHFAYFSLLNVSGTAEGIWIKNAKYPLENGWISTDYQYGISNEVIPGEKAEVSVQKGKLLLIKVF